MIFGISARILIVSGLVPLMDMILFFSSCPAIRITKQVSSMILSGRPTVPSVAITIFSIENCFVLSDFENQGRMDGRTPHEKIVITTGRDCGSAEWINTLF